MAFARKAFAGSVSVAELPAPAEFAWLAFNEMRGAVKYDSPISHSEMRAYAEMTGNVLRPLEVGWVRDLDRAWMEMAASKAREAAQRGRQPQGRQIPIDDIAGIDRLLSRHGGRHG